MGVNSLIAFPFFFGDVPAAAFSAWFYQKKGHLRIRESLTLLISVLLFTFAGSRVSQYVPSPALGSVSIVWSLIMGIRFLFLPNISTAKLQEEQSAAEKITFTVVMGAVVGFISGFAGAGGGMMTLFVLTTFLNFEIKDAVGTSVFIMTFTSLVGGVSHLSIGVFPISGHFSSARSSPSAQRSSAPEPPTTRIPPNSTGSPASSSRSSASS